MGFVPVIDSYEAWYGGDWSSRKEVVAWASGADLMLRARTMGDKAKDSWETTISKSPRDFNAHQHRWDYAIYHGEGVKEGRDDITSLNLLQHNSLDGPEEVIVGRASGDLVKVSLYKRTSRNQIQSSFATEGRPVRSATTNTGSQDLLAACLSDTVVALYPISTSNMQVAPTVETIATPPGQPGRTWTSQFLNKDRLVVGYGISQQPIRVYNIGRGDLTSECADTIGFSDAGADETFRALGHNNDGATSVYSLAPIATSSSIGRAEGDLFLSGAYDGLCR
jgi:hypothetical protein